MVPAECTNTSYFAIYFCSVANPVRNGVILLLRLLFEDLLMLKVIKKKLEVKQRLQSG